MKNNIWSNFFPFLSLLPFCHFFLFASDRNFKLKKYLDVHLEAHATEKYVCDACGRLFVSQQHLQRHLCRAVTSQPVTVSPKEITSEIHIKTEDGERNQEVVLPDELLQQLLKGEQLLVKNSDEEEEHQMVIVQEDMQAQQVFLCGICNQFYETAEKVALHMEEHRVKLEQEEVVYTVVEEHVTS